MKQPAQPIPWPHAAQSGSQDEPQLAIASQWRLMWWKFRKHRLAMISLVIVVTLYTVALFAGFFAPHAKTTYHRGYTQAPPQKIHWLDNGKLAPYVYGYQQETDPRTFERRYAVDEDVKIPLGFFVKGDPYTIGLKGIPVDWLNWLHITTDRHFFGPKHHGDPFYLAGADDLGRDVWSRLIFASQISLSVGLVGVALSLGLGIILGGLSGLIGGRVDNAIQRLIELLRSIPDIPLWMALATAVPARWDPTLVYFGITVVLSLLGWTHMARVVRGRFLSLREEDFILAAELDGVSRFRIITRHMVPSFLSHIIASVTLAIPGMILGETALSFLGLGLQAPVVSWGVMLKDAQSIRVIANMPWMLLPGVAVTLTVLVFNFLGDGLRDAADPYR
ncbi:MAG: ABC transporter permease [Chloroflexi bacterium]|nr:ABC transporter permease [Chloroflexota bacterium]